MIFILYVKDQQISKDFYRALLRKEPVLDVPGMTEFELEGGARLGLMPEEGIAAILGDTLPHPSKGNGIPRCEVYLYVSDLELEYENALKAGAKLISSIKNRNWGDRVCYFSDPDGNVVAFAGRE